MPWRRYWSILANNTQLMHGWSLVTIITIVGSLPTTVNWIIVATHVLCLCQNDLKGIQNTLLKLYMLYSVFWSNPSIYTIIFPVLHVAMELFSSHHHLTSIRRTELMRVEHVRIKLGTDHACGHPLSKKRHMVKRLKVQLPHICYI